VNVRAQLSRVFRDKRHLIVPLAIAAIVNVAALVLLVYPLSRRVAATEQRASEVGQQLLRATTDYRLARGTLDGRQHTDDQLARFYVEVLPRNQTAARRITYLKLAQLARDANLDYDRRSFRVDEIDDESTLRRLDITFPLTGEYRDMRRFIHTLETAPEFIVIRDVSLAKQQTGASKEPLALLLKLATYYRADDER
jgi:Tfp pilus assembly protein PilO